MDCPRSGAPAGSLAFALMAQHAICRLERMARSSQLPAACRLRSMPLRICQNLAFPDHSGAKAEIRYSQCSREESRRLCSSAWTAIRMPSLSRAADALSLISKQIWRVPAPSGAKPVTKELAHYRQLERRLWMTRWRHAGQESAKGDDLNFLASGLAHDFLERDRGSRRSVFLRHMVPFKNLARVIVFQSSPGGRDNLEEQVHTDGKIRPVQEARLCREHHSAQARQLVVPASGSDDDVLPGADAG